MAGGYSAIGLIRSKHRSQVRSTNGLLMNCFGKLTLCFLSLGFQLLIRLTITLTYLCTWMVCLIC